MITIKFVVNRLFEKFDDYGIMSYYQRPVASFAKETLAEHWIVTANAEIEEIRKEHTAGVALLNSSNTDPGMSTKDRIRIRTEYQAASEKFRKSQDVFKEKYGFGPLTNKIILQINKTYFLKT